MHTIEKDAKEISKRFFKYFLEAFAVTFANYFLLNKQFNNLMENLTKHNSRKIQSATTESQKRVKKINKDFHNTFNRGQKRLIRIGKLL